MKIAMLTGGGDCPWPERCDSRGWCAKGIFTYEDEFIGFKEGWRGVIDDKSMPLDLDAVGGILPRGGTPILRTSRTNPSKRSDGIDRCMATLEKNQIDALIAIGGDDTLSVAQKLHERGAKVIGVPKTIDNDLVGTDYTFGFDTACNIVCEALDRVHTTAEAHNRVMVVEVMGRDAGWIALYSGIAGGADVILIPERPFDVDKVADSIRQRHERGRYFSIVVVAEGAKFSSEPGQGSPVLQDMGKDEFGHVKPRRHCQHPGPWKSKNAPASGNPAPWSWDTFSAAARPAPSIASSQLATAWAQSTWCTAANSDAWPPSAPTRSSRSHCSKPSRATAP